MYFETSDAYVKREVSCCPCLYSYENVHVVCNDATIKIGTSLSKSSEGHFEYLMDLMDAKISVSPLYLQVLLKDNKRKYIIMMRKIEDYMFMIRSMNVQRQQKIREKEIYLSQRIHYLHRQNALYVSAQTQEPCSKIYPTILVETKKRRTPYKKIQSFYRMSYMAKRKKMHPCLVFLLC